MNKAMYWDLAFSVSAVFKKIIPWKLNSSRTDNRTTGIHQSRCHVGICLSPLKAVIFTKGFKTKYRSFSAKTISCE